MISMSNYCIFTVAISQSTSNVYDSSAIVKSDMASFQK